MEKRCGEIDRRGVASRVERHKRLGPRCGAPRAVAGPVGQERADGGDPQFRGPLEEASTERVVEIRGEEIGKRSLERLSGRDGIARVDRLPRSVDATAHRRLAPGPEDVEGQGTDRHRRVGPGCERHEALGIGLRPRCLGRSHRPAEKCLVERPCGNALCKLAPHSSQREIVDRPGCFGGHPRVGVVQESSHDVTAKTPQGDHRSQTHPR